MANLATILAQQGDLGQAIDTFRIALRLDPGAVSTRGNLALALARAGRPEEAAAEYESLQATGAGRLDLAEALAAAYAAGGRWEAAVTTGEHALALAERTRDEAAAGRLRTQVAGYRAHRSDASFARVGTAPQVVGKEPGAR